MSENEVEYPEDDDRIYVIKGINMQLALFETQSLRDFLKTATKPWFPVHRGQVLKLKQRYQDKRVGDLILVVKDSANHEIFIATSGNDMYKKFSGHRDNFDPAHDAEVMKMFGKGAKVEKTEETETGEPNSEEELQKLDDSDNSGDGAVDPIVTDGVGGNNNEVTRDNTQVEPGEIQRTPINPDMNANNAQVEPGGAPAANPRHESQ